MHHRFYAGGDRGHEALDIYGHEFTLLDELPQFHAFVPDFYVSEHTVTNDQFAKLLNKMAGQFSGDPWYIRRLSKIAELEKRAVE